MARSEDGGGGSSGRAAIERAHAAEERRDRELALVARETDALRRGLEAATQRPGEPTHLLRVVTEEASRRRAILARRESATDVAEAELAEAQDDMATARRSLREVEGRVDGFLRRLRLIAAQVDAPRAAETARHALGARRREAPEPAPEDDPLVQRASVLRRVVARCAEADAALDEAWTEELGLRRIFDREVSDESMGVGAAVLEAVTDLLGTSVHLGELSAQLQRQARESGAELARAWSDLAATWEREAALRREASRLAGLLESLAMTVGASRRRDGDAS